MRWSVHASGQAGRFQAGRHDKLPAFQASTPARCKISLIGPAFGFRSVNAQSIQLGYLMEKPFLRRDRDHHSAIGQKDRLTKLEIPIPERQSLALERRNSEIGTLEKIKQGPRHKRTRSR